MRGKRANRRSRHRSTHAWAAASHPLPGGLADPDMAAVVAEEQSSKGKSAMDTMRGLLGEIVATETQFSVEIAAAG